jgi:hypothetical protein
MKGVTVEALCHKAGDSRLDSRWASWEFLSDLIFLSALSSPGVHSASKRNEY